MNKTAMISLPRCLPVVAFAALASGCATMGGGEFACPAPDGVSCMSAIEIYEATNARTNLESGPEMRGAPNVVEGGGSLSLAPVARSGVVTDGASLSLASAPVARGSDLPLRAEAKVMRIWVAPWTDEAGDLVMPGHIFTEIEGRRWTIGGQLPSAASTLFDPNRIAGDGHPSFNPNP